MINEMIRLLCANAEIIGIDRELCYLVHDIFIDLAQKKMGQNNPLFSKLENMLEKVKLVSHPDDFDHENLNYKANVRIRIPMVPEDHDEEKEEGEKEEEGEGENEEEGEGEEKKEEEPEEKKETEPVETEGDEKRTPSKPKKMIEDRLEDKVILINPN